MRKEVAGDLAAGGIDRIEGGREGYINRGMVVLQTKLLVAVLQTKLLVAVLQTKLLAAVFRRSGKRTCRQSGERLADEVVADLQTNWWRSCCVSVTAAAPRWLW